MNNPISPRKTFALFCATGKDWRSDSRLTDELCSQILTAVQPLRGQKQAAREVAEKILSGETVDKIDVVSFEDIFAMAHAAGHIAATVKTPVPMVVQAHANMLDDSSPVVQEWHESEGMCGFASVVIKSGNCPFANWLKKHHQTYKHYYGGLDYPIHDYGQSYERKTAYAEAFAKKLSEHGIKAYAGSRLD
ncbi:MAG: hypothetical protein KGI71_06240 [Patescibacteria group bacterium]|nr:hypothetical protein [Patescibacteria group bacterium]